MTSTRGRMAFGDGTEVRRIRVKALNDNKYGCRGCWDREAGRISLRTREQQPYSLSSAFMSFEVMGTAATIAWVPSSSLSSETPPDESMRANKAVAVS